MNLIILLGNITRDPEILTTVNGINKCSFTIAVNRRFAKDGEQSVDFINIVTWRTLADNCYKFLKKGNKCCVTGTLQTRTYDAQDGSKRYITEVVADNVEFLTPKQDDVKQEEKTTKFEPIDDSNLPF